MDLDNVRCFACGEQGHLRAECPNRTRLNGGPEDRKPRQDYPPVPDLPPGVPPTEDYQQQRREQGMPYYAAVLTVACPFCHASVGGPCWNAGTKQYRAPHPSRAELAALVKT